MTEFTPYPLYENLNLDKEQGGREVFEFEPLFEIGRNEELIISDREIVLSSYLICRGKLELFNCRITYNIGDESNLFILENGAEMIAEDCVFIGTGLGGTPLIKADGASAEFSGCLFDSCVWLIEAEASTVLFTGCELDNCRHFAVCRDSRFDLIKSKITIADDLINPLRVFSEVLIYTENCEGSINEVQYIGGRKADICLYPKGLTVENSLFQDMGRPIHGAKEIKNCNFVNCNGAIGTPDCRYSKFLEFDGTQIVDGCNFFCCENTIHNALTVKNCTFDSNYGTAITTQFGKGVTVYGCYFKELSGKGAKEPIICYCVSEKMNVNIERCVFEDCDFGIKWGIGPKENSVFIDNPVNPEENISFCAFKNCTAAEELHGAFVYPGPLYKQRLIRENKPVFGVIKINGCTGLADDDPWTRYEKSAVACAIMKGKYKI